MSDLSAPAITKSDLRIIDKADLAPMASVSLDAMTLGSRNIRDNETERAQRTERGSPFIKKNSLFAV
ncbi:hypothetical protein KQH49_11700 [Mycetohabitans sp. B5]|uniref:urease accessory protein UreG n=1 Tax=Mycetohabitans TaxID=2571159 RepID=UPI0011B02456|nr:MULTISPECIES: urease accessory protein UreG [Mycetohabitans]MCG1055557.1 hypothetical protein [Mycetohabitans sp. B5]